MTHPITYKIRDQNGEEIKGTFYREELQKTDQNIYRIEKIIRKRQDKALVKMERLSRPIQQLDTIKRFRKNLKLKNK